MPGTRRGLPTNPSPQECARYLELFKAYENKPAASIQARADTDYVGRLTAALTSVRGVNRNDAYTIGATFGTLADAFRGAPAQFAACPGLGPVKARRLHDAFSQPFRRALVAGQQQRQQQQQQQQQQQPAAPPEAGEGSAPPLVELPLGDDDGRASEEEDDEG
jgi:NAD-dependent DNA ligase